MRKKILLALTFTAASLVCVTHHLWSNLSGAPGKYTSAPGDFGNCLTAGCHVGNTVNASGGNFSMKLLDGTNEVTEWIGGKQYNVNVTLNKAGIEKYGFEISAKKGATSANMGTFAPGAGTSKIAPSTNNAYITHNNPGGGNWNFTWTAPAASSDAITFYVVGNAANGDNTSNGDFVYTLTKTFNSAKVSIGETAPFASNVIVKQNPVSDYLIVDFEQAKPEATSIKIYNLQGQELRLPVSLQGEGTTKRFVIETASLEKGMYIFSIQSGNQQAAKKFLRE